jgi:hypothetical protein
MDGIWTYIIPENVSGGILVIREGRVVGGDGTYVCTGTCDVDDDVVRLNLSYEMFNPQGSLGSAWGDNAPKIEVLFEGTAFGDIIYGKARRPGFDQTVAVTMSHHGDAP